MSMSTKAPENATAEPVAPTMAAAHSRTGRGYGLNWRRGGGAQSDGQELVGVGEIGVALASLVILRNARLPWDTDISS
jgi:hypothetical protein